jgi:hypothetical protein
VTPSSCAYLRTVCPWQSRRRAADDEHAVYAVARHLGRSDRPDQEAYNAAHRFPGDAGTAELVSLCGYYTLVSFLLNAFTVPPPPEAAPIWEGS